MNVRYPVMHACLFFLPLFNLQALEQAYRKAERALEQERRATESAERAAAAAEKKLEK